MPMLTMELFEDLWAQRQSERDGVAHFWDRRAPSFNSHTRGEESRKRRHQLVTRIARKAGLEASDAVLDIGCGPGAHALELAALAGHVEAFDIAPKMVELARQNAIQDGCGNVRFRVLDWVEADIDVLGWRKKFQLVLASKTPAVNDRSTLEKMLAVSCGCCCMITQVHTRHSVRDQLKPLVNFDERNSRMSHSFYCVFNLLWLMGFYPEVEYFDRAWERHSSLEDAELMYVRYFENMGPVSEGQKEALLRRLSDISRDGQVRERVQSKVALMFWAV